MTGDIDDPNHPSFGVVRNERGQWIKPYKSPGRPKGLSHSEKLRALLEPHRDELIGRALELTRSTDPFAAANALRICLERLAPAPKQEAEKVELPELARATTFEGKCRAIVDAVANGEISSDAADKLLRMVDVYRRAIAVDALEARVAVLEGRKAPPAFDNDNAEDLS